MLHYSLKVFFQSHHDLQKRILCDLPVSACIRTAHTALDNPTDFVALWHNSLTYVAMKKAFLQSVCACINFWWRALLVDGSRSSFFFNAQYQIGKNMQIHVCGKKNASGEYKNDANECHCATNG
jgi:hypothetical protein